MRGGGKGQAIRIFSIGRNCVISTGAGKVENIFHPLIKLQMKQIWIMLCDCPYKVNREIKEEWPTVLFPQKSLCSV